MVSEQSSDLETRGESTSNSEVNTASTPSYDSQVDNNDKPGDMITPNEDQSPVIPPDAALDDTGIPFTKEQIERKEPKGRKKKIFVTEAQLYCPKTGYPHAVVQEMGVRRCPACGQSLYSRRVDEVRVADNLEGTPGNTYEIAYEVHIRDSGGYFLGQEPWDALFDIKEARKGLPAAAQNAILKVATVLRTSHNADKDRGASECKFILERDIFSDPTVSMRVHNTRLEIKSTQFVHLLKGLSPYYPGLDLDAETLYLSEPYAIIAYHAKEIETYQKTYDPSSPVNGDIETTSHSVLSTTFPRICDQETYDHIDIILGFIKENVWKDKLALEKARHNRPEPICTYAMLWMLYEPGTTVYIETKGRLAAYVVQLVDFDPAVLTLPPEKLDPYKLSVWYLDFDGRYIRRFCRNITIMPFSGEKPITSLSAIPCQYQDLKDGNETKKRLHNEGEQWFKLLRGGLIRYMGDNLETPRKYIDGRVYIDCSSYHEQRRREKRRAKKKSRSKKDGANDSSDDENEDAGGIANDEHEDYEEPKLVDDFGVGSQKCPCEECMGIRPHPPMGFRWVEYDLINPFKEESLKLPDGHLDAMHRYLLCSKRLMGFALKTRTWGINKTAIDTLVMPDDRKKMIKALVHHFRTGPQGEEKAWSADFIENKGEGKIFLLHGSPGVGKTYTAECIAEFTERPLLSLTCGDLGNNETTVEKELSKWFKMAEKWGAVLLLDEADVYTEKRLVADLNRNSMVSVFLRCMEYYRGILFLTTNRVGHFDDAFVSRIHVIIHYKDLSEGDRRQIWTQFFSKLESDKRGVRVRKSARDFVLKNPDVASIAWNGREIRNAFQTAVALCEYEAKTQGEPGEPPALERDHFEQVLEMSQQFKRYLHEVHGADEAGRAAITRARAMEADTSIY